MKNIDINRLRINSSGVLRKNIINKATNSKATNNTNNTNFDNILNTFVQKDGVKFSKHATKRLSERNIKLNKDNIEKLTKAISDAESKGIKDALILMNNVAFIANVQNKTIITTVESNNLKDNVFTNIDGAVIV
ncbi:hypothetical protein PV797_08420 [Clostridiaceae bacterium M8S5]|nr:hypothetical protein PV797_08420 [Clostridiaceae bacterium M8S5]